MQVAVEGFGETTTEEGHEFFFRGKENKHELGVGFLVHKDIANTVLGCHPVSSRILTIRLRAAPFNITIGQVCALTSDNADKEIEEFYENSKKTYQLLPSKIVQENASQKNKRRLTNGQKTALICTITRPFDQY